MKNYMLPAINSHAYMVTTKKKLSRRGHVCGLLPYDVLIFPCIVSSVTIGLDMFDKECVSAKVILNIPGVTERRPGDETDLLVRSIGGQLLKAVVPGVTLFEKEEDAQAAAKFFSENGLITIPMTDGDVHVTTKEGKEITKL